MIYMSIQELLRLEKNINNIINHLEEIDIEIFLVTRELQQQLDTFTELLSYIYIYPDIRGRTKGLVTHKRSKLPFDIIYLIKQEIKKGLKALNNHLFDLYKDRNNLLKIRRDLLNHLRNF